MQYTNIMNKKTDVASKECVTIGFINSNDQLTHYSNIEHSLNSIIADKGWQIISLNSGGDPSLIYQNTESLVNMEVDAVVAFNDMSRFPKDSAALLKNENIPFIILDNPLEKAVFCGFDYVDAGEMLADKLLSSAKSKFKSIDYVLALQSVEPYAEQNSCMNSAIDKFKSANTCKDTSIMTVMAAPISADVSDSCKDFFAHINPTSGIIIVCESAEHAQAASEAILGLKCSDNAIVGCFDRDDSSLFDNATKQVSAIWNCSVLFSSDTLKNQLRFALTDIVGNTSNSAKDYTLKPQINTKK